MNSKTKVFFSALLVTTTLPYLPFLFTFLPWHLFGFNMTGWAWIIMLLFSIISLVNIKHIEFPILIWAPWFVYLMISLIANFSFIGLQLTLQYVLPLLVGVIASGIRYSFDDLKWIFKAFTRVCIFLYVLSIIGILFRGGYGPSVAATPMLFSVAVSLLAGLYFMTKEKAYIIYIGLIFLVPIAEMSRMGIAAIVAAFFLHFANTNLRNKTLFMTVGALVLIAVFNLKGFQEKTFKSGKGKLLTLKFDYYSDSNIRSSGRLSWKKALDPGLKAEPVWGNGPRSDNEQLVKVSKKSYGEAHNDYLSVRYNYGYVGLSCLLVGFALTFISIYRLSRKYNRNDLIWLLSTSVLTLFISFLMFMYTDNILKYTIYFPNYFFALIGITYSLTKNENLSYNPALQ